MKTYCRFLSALILSSVAIANLVRPALAYDVLDPNFAPSGFNTGAVVFAIAVQSDGKVIVGGNFTYPISGGGFTNLLRLNTDGTLDNYFGNSPVDGTVYSILVEPDDKIVIGGAFSKVGAYSRTCIARLLANGTVDSGFLPASPNNYVFAVGRQSDGKIIVGGAFTTVKGYSQTRVARLSSTGSYDSTFNPGISGSGSPVVYSLAIYPDTFPSEDKIIIGGNFNSVGSYARTNVARLNSNGSVDTSFITVSSSTSSPLNGSVYAVAVDYGPFTTSGTGGSDVEKVYIGGAFTSFDSRDYFGRLDSNGSPEYNTDSAYVDGVVESIRIQSDHLILLGGAFTHAKSFTRNGIARLFPGTWGGSVNDLINVDQDWADYSPNGASGGTVEALAVGGDDEIYVGGGFTAFEGESQQKIARLFPSE